MVYDGRKNKIRGEETRNCFQPALLLGVDAVY